MVKWTLPRSIAYNLVAQPPAYKHVVRVTGLLNQCSAVSVSILNTATCENKTLSTTTHNYLLLGLRTIASSLDSSFANHFDLFDLCEALSRIPVFHNHHHHNIHDYNHHHGFLPGSNTPPYFLQDPRLLDRDHSVLLLFATFRISDQATANRDPTTTARLSLFPALSSF